MSTKQPGVLILSHCGFSFLEDLHAVIGQRGLRCFVLSSLPLPEHVPARLEKVESWADRLLSTDQHALCLDDVQKALASLRESGEDVLCCISVWEGYRHLMAAANAHLGTYDLEPEKTLALRNKLLVRHALVDLGLSKANAYALTASRLALLKNQDQHYFIKPIHGIASYGAFPLRQSTSWQELEAIKQEAAADTVYASAFNGGLAFMAEQYISGREFSFETLIVDGQVHVVAIHEKYEVTEAAQTVLENSCTTPPVSLNQAQLADGLSWLSRVLQALALKWGCFHIEARYTGEYWDLIEINPRVGGSLISHSVEAITQGQGLLSLWLDLLLASQDDAKARERYVARLQQLSWSVQGTSPLLGATFFQVYFAEPGTVRSIELQALPLAPSVKHILLKEGDVIPAHAREVFLGQLLWTFEREAQTFELQRLAQVSPHALKVSYLTQAG